MRFGFALQRTLAAPFRPEVAGFRTIPLRRFSDPGTHAVNRLVPAVFRASRLPCFPVRFSKTPPVQVIRGRIRCRPRTGPTPGSYRGLAGIVVIRSRRRSWVFMPFAVSLRFPGERVFQRLGPTCRFAPPPTASFIVAGSAAYCGPWVSCRGFWASAPKTSRAVRSADPAIAFAHRVAQIHQPGLPWAFSPLSGFHRRVAASTSGDVDAHKLPARASQRVCMARRDDRACPSACTRSGD